MKTYNVVVSDEVNNAIESIANKDGKTPTELIQEQVNYYVNCVISDKINVINNLSIEEQLEVNSIILNTKNEAVNNIISNREI